MFRWFSKKSSLNSVRYEVLKNHAEKYQIPISDFDRWDAALTHISCGESGIKLSYERLEFLGDAVLGLCLSDILYTEYVDLTEGRMSVIKSGLVDEKTLAEVGRELEFLQIIRLGRGEKLADPRAQTKVLCDIFESTLATIFLSDGFSKSREFTHRIFKDRIETTMRDGVKDYKTLLQKVTVKVYKEYPVYKIVGTEGPAHSKVFTIQCSVAEFVSLGQGRSKKDAERHAAESILKQMLEFIKDHPHTYLATELYSFKKQY